MQRAPWGLLLAFSALRVHSRPLCRLLPIQSFPAASRLLGPYHSVFQAAMLRRDDALDVMHWVICPASSVSSSAWTGWPRRSSIEHQACAFVTSLEMNA